MAHLLLIEPNTLLGEMYAKSLQFLGHTVTITQGAQEAISAADTQVPDVVIMELQLAAHTGIEFLHEFRSYTEWRDTPIIVHTVLSPRRLSQIEQPLLNDLGVRAILYKPRTSLQKLGHAVNEQLARL